MSWGNQCWWLMKWRGAERYQLQKWRQSFRVWINTCYQPAALFQYSPSQLCKISFAAYVEVNMIAFGRGTAYDRSPWTLSQLKVERYCSWGVRVFVFQNGVVECRRIFCPPANCSEDSLPVHVDGSCCKKCRRKYHKDKVTAKHYNKTGYMWAEINVKALKLARS